MLVVKGAHRGETVTPRQFANDWVLTEEYPAEPFSPAALQLVTDDDRVFFTVRDPREVGTFWGEWRLDEQGRFHRILTEPPRAARRASAREQYGRVVRRAVRRRPDGP
ncbi:MAG: hypothetical protein HOY78_02140 [Saccharothrix sp.]|nr:hypothetical protein [Saccharothrix sp.]